MKIIFFRHSLLSRGGDKMVITYANYLAEKGHRVSIWTNHINTVFELSPLIKIKKIPLKTKMGTILTAMLRKFDHDVIIVDIIVLATLLSLRNRRKVLYFAQDNDIYYYKDKLRQEFINFVYKFGLGKLNIPCIAVSDNLAKELKKYTHNIQVVPNGIDLNEFYYDPDEKLLRLKGNKKVILIFGRPDYRKGLDIAMRVINKLLEVFSEEEIEIWVVGDSIPENMFPYMARNFGYVPSDKLRNILSSADVFLYPSRHEGLPLFLLEAMACRCPVVTTKTTGIIRHLQEGWVSSIGNGEDLCRGIITVFKKESIKNTFVNKGLMLVKKFDLSLSKERFEKIIFLSRMKFDFK